MRAERASPRDPRVEPAALLKLLTNEVRWRLVVALASSDRKVNELVQAVGQPPNLVSYHLGQLRGVRLVSERRSSADARDVYYSLDLERLQAALERCAGTIHPGLWPDPSRAVAELPARRVLFLCTHNSARSQMAEAILRQQGGDAVDVRSAGSEPSQVHVLALRTLAELGIERAGLRAKPLSTFAGDNFDYVITLCDIVREAGTSWPGKPERLHWSLADVLGSAHQIEVDVEVRSAAEIPLHSASRGPVVHASLSDGARSADGRWLSLQHDTRRAQLRLMFPAMPGRVREVTLRLDGELGTWQVRVPVRSLGGVARRLDVGAAGSVTGPEAVREVYLGPDGAAAVPGKLFAEMSTGGPWSALELEPAVCATGSSTVDAPLVGTVAAAAGGTPEILAGGRPEYVRAVEAVLSRLGHLRYVGPLGSGARLKLVSNAMLGGSLALAAELQRLGTAVGLDPESVLWALSARFPYLAQQRTAILEHRHDQVAFAMRDLTKDLDLAAGLERDTAMSLPLSDHARRLFDEAPPELGGQNVTAIMETDV
jgi:ArsR family transcriptional regulator, arsenate/arsenite/antimonite-responsive transcriptional repressor / arsenate reductase (thioredoxin)